MIKGDFRGDTNQRGKMDGSAGASTPGGGGGDGGNSGDGGGLITEREANKSYKLSNRRETMHSTANWFVKHPIPKRSDKFYPFGGIMEYSFPTNCLSYCKLMPHKL